MSSSFSSLPDDTGLPPTAKATISSVKARPQFLQCFLGSTHVRIGWPQKAQNCGTSVWNCLSFGLAVIFVTLVCLWWRAQCSGCIRIRLITCAFRTRTFEYPCMAYPSEPESWAVGCREVPSDAPFHSSSCVRRRSRSRSARN